MTLSSPAPNVWRAGDAHVNFYLIAQGSDLTLVDAGLPGHWDQLVAALATVGHSLQDVRAVVVSHGHADHIGVAERLRRLAGASIWVHALDAPILGAPRHTLRWWRPERSLLSYFRFGPRVLQGPLHLLRRGGLRLQAVSEVSTFEDGSILDVPGRPRAIHLPGHTAGSSAFVFEDREVIFTGDSLVTVDAVTGQFGPRVLCGAFTQNTRQALASLDRLAVADVPMLLPGHGEPWRRGVAAAVQLAKAAGSN